MGCAEEPAGGLLVVAPLARAAVLASLCRTRSAVEWGWAGQTAIWGWVHLTANLHVSCSSPYCYPTESRALIVAAPMWVQAPAATCQTTRSVCPWKVSLRPYCACRAKRCSLQWHLR